MKHYVTLILGALVVLPAHANTAHFGPTISLQKTLRARIDSTKNRCLVATYLLTSAPLVTALLNAHKRNVTTGVVVDASMTNTPRGRQVLGKLRAIGVPTFVYKGKQRHLMHHKFAVLDTEVWTGSMNWTRAGSTRHHENAVVINNPGVVTTFAQHFATLKRRTHKLAAHTPLHPNMYLIPDHKKQLLTHLLAALKKARNRITLALYDLTSKKLVHALHAAARRGVAVKMYADGARARENQHSQVMALARTPRITVKVFNHARTLLHHKYAIIDDAVWTGSMNWTGNGMRYNQENVVVLRASNVVAQFTRNADYLDGVCAKTPLPADSSRRHTTVKTGFY